MDSVTELIAVTGEVSTSAGTIYYCPTHGERFIGGGVSTLKLVPTSVFSNPPNGQTQIRQFYVDEATGELTVTDSAGNTWTLQHIGYVGITNTDTPYTTVASDRIIGVDSTAGVVTVTLASSLVDTPRTILIKDEGGQAASNNITIATEGSETLDGAATVVLNTAYGSAGFYTNGTNWFKI